MNICKTEQEYINAVAPAAQTVCKKYGTMLPSVIIGQSCLENGYGISSYWDNPQIEALMKYNNMLGMKSSLLNDSWADKTVWTGKSLTKKTPEVYNGKKVTITDSFRIYESVKQCFADYILFLLYASNNGKGGTPKYGRAVTDIKDPETLIKTINAKGYATNPNYWKSVMAIINKHNLTQYDKVGEHMATNIKKLIPPKFIDNRAASKSQIKNWRDKSNKKYIVVHYLGVVGQNQNLWNGGYGATFTIFWNGDVYYTADYTAVTWQCGGRIQGESKDGNGVAPHRFYGKCTNYNSVSIESCVKRTDNKYEGGNDDKWYFTEETQESLVWAVSKMMDDLNIPIDRVIRHFDVTGKACPNPYVRNNGQNGNWTWDEFINNVKQYRKDGTITIPDRSKNPVTPDSSSSSTRNYLKKGDKGDAVKTMQNMLIKCGYDLGKYGADGDFGSKTEDAVKAFQKDHDLDVDSYYGPKTKSALEAAYKSQTEVLKKGSKGESVKKLQEMLIALRFLEAGEADGDFGEKTDSALKTAQFSLLGEGQDDGEYGPKSRAAVEKAYKIATDKRFIYRDVNFAWSFDPEYYGNRYADLNEHYHGDEQKLFRHWIKWGITERRQAREDFNVVKYCENYPKLVDHYDGNLVKIVAHWCNYGWHEGRKGI